MEKLQMKSQGATPGNVAKIAALFPNCVTERLDKDGNPEMVVDFDKLRQELSTELVEGDAERYQFTWPDKRAANHLANQPTTMTLRPCVEESVGKDGTAGGFDSENLYIEGGILDVLKVLRETYLGKVKMIYIDPPYNTGNDFVYNDDFASSYEEFAESCKVRDENGNLTFDPKANGESNGRLHTDWLNMIYPRLKVARDLLSDDGVVCISIDNNEVQRLQFVCDEVFGMKNRITSITWEKGRKNDSTFYSDSVEYIVIYAKNIQCLLLNGPWRAKKEGMDDVIEYYKSLRSMNLSHPEIERKMQSYYAGLPKDDVKRQMKHFYHSDDRGLFFGADISSASTSIPDYEIIHPITNKPVKKPSRGWGATEPVMLERIKDGRILFGEDETTIPLKKSYLTEVDSIVKTPVIYKMVERLEK